MALKRWKKELLKARDIPGLKNLKTYLEAQEEDRGGFPAGYFGLSEVKQWRSGLGILKVDPKNRCAAFIIEHHSWTVSTGYGPSCITYKVIIGVYKSGKAKTKEITWRTKEYTLIEEHYTKIKKISRLEKGKIKVRVEATEQLGEGKTKNYQEDFVF